LFTFLVGSCGIISFFAIAFLPSLATLFADPEIFQHFYAFASNLDVFFDARQPRDSGCVVDVIGFWVVPIPLDLDDHTFVVPTCFRTLSSLMLAHLRGYGRFFAH